MALHWAAVAAISRPATYWHMLPEATQARKAIWDAVDPHTGKRRIDIAFPHAIRANTRDQDMLIRFVNGSTWQVIGSDNYDSLVGAPPAGVVFSEWALAKPEAKSFLQPMLLENGGWQLYITTPRGPNHAKRSFDNSVKTHGHFAQRLTARETGVFTEAQLDAQLAEYQSDHGEDVGMAMFEQEYLCSFDAVMTGRAVFGRKPIKAALEECYKPKYRADIDSGGKIVKRDDGRLSVWADPVPGRKYVIGADVAEGLEHGDYSCSDVLDAVTGRQVAQWHGHIDPDRFGDVNCNLGKRYNNALLGIERNNHGLTTITRIKDLRYKNIYAQEALDNMYEEGSTGKAGWLTTSKSKPKIIDALAAELRDEDHGICCKETIQEMGSYIIHDDGSLGAQPGGYDDRVMARAIAGEMLRSAGISKILATKTSPTTKRRTADKVGGY